MVEAEIDAVMRAAEREIDIVLPALVAERGSATECDRRVMVTDQQVIGRGEIVVERQLVIPFSFSLPFEGTAFSLLDFWIM